MRWHLYNGAPSDALGLIPAFLSERSEAGAQAQLDAAYQGGFRPTEGFTLNRKLRFAKDWTLDYAGDRPMHLIGSAKLREELILVFEYAWVCIVQRDGTFVVARMD